MAPNNVPHLCGGILFDLLLEARKPRRKARKKFDGGTDGLSDPDVYDGLVYLVTGERCSSTGKSKSKSVSNYKNCTSSKGIYVPFTESATQSAFNSKYILRNPELYQRTAEFIDSYLSKDKCEWLVRAIIDTLQHEKIDVELSINYNDSLNVSELHTAECIVFLPFLLSVIHYVVMNHPDCESGRPTFEEWYSQSNSRSEWKFNSSIGQNLNPMNVSLDLEFPLQTKSKESSKECPTQSSILPLQDNSNDVRTDREVITDGVRKALQVAADALEVQKAQIPSAEQMGKPLLIVAEAIKIQEHEMAERWRSNEKQKSETEPNGSVDAETANIKESDIPITSDSKETTGNVVHQTVVNQYGDHPVHIDHVDTLNL